MDHQTPDLGRTGLPRASRGPERTVPRELQPLVLPYPATQPTATRQIKKLLTMLHTKADAVEREALAAIRVSAVRLAEVGTDSGRGRGRNRDGHDNGPSLGVE